MRALKIAIALLALVSARGVRAEPQTRATERAQLQRSLDTSCKTFAGTEDERWAKADLCRRAWFKVHEEAIWRLKINPHARPVQAPSS